MIKNILAVGDSFTYGEELADKTSAFPIKLAHKMSAFVHNIAQPAASNDKILRICLEYLLEQPNTDLVIIGWSNIGRSEYADDIGYFDIWPGYSGNLFKKDSLDWRQELIDYNNKYHSIEHLQRKYFQQILLLQSFLKSKNIKYVMMNIVQNEYYKTNYFWQHEYYLPEIDMTNWIDFGKAGMVEWTYGTKKGPFGHPLEDGHIIIANKIYEHIRNLGWVS